MGANDDSAERELREARAGLARVKEALDAASLRVRRLESALSILCGEPRGANDYVSGAHPILTAFRGRGEFGLRDIVALGFTRGYTRVFLHRAVRAGKARRARRGVYVVDGEG